MGYERAGMGHERFQEMDPLCSGHAAGPLARCFPSSEASIARRMDCAAESSPATGCDYVGPGGEGHGTIHCCPRPAAGAKEPEAGWAAGLLYPAELLIEKIGDAASRVATVAAGREEASLAPVSETEDRRSLLEIWTPYITIGSTLLGVGLFAWWLVEHRRAKLPSALPAPSRSRKGSRSRNPRLSDYEQGFYAGLHDATTIGKKAAEKKITRLARSKPAKYVSGYREGLRQGMQTLRWKPNPARSRGPSRRTYKLHMWEQLHEAKELREQVSTTRLAENAAWDHNEDWRLDDPDDEVWDWAIEVMDKFENEYSVRMRP